MGTGRKSKAWISREKGWANQAGEQREQGRGGRNLKRICKEIDRWFGMAGTKGFFSPHENS